MAGVVGIIVYRVVNPNGGNGDASTNTGSTAWNSQVYSANQNSRCVHSATEPPKVESKPKGAKVDSTRKMRPARYSRRHTRYPEAKGTHPNLAALLPWQVTPRRHRQRGRRTGTGQGS